MQIQTQQGYTEFFSWGNDEDGQLGHGQEDPNRKKVFNLPKSLSFEVLIAQISCGNAHTAFISKQGYVFAFGSNSDGQLGINDQTIKFSTAPLLVSDLISMQATPVQLSCGGYHTGVVTNVGEVYMWGRNLQGQCGRSINYNQYLFAPHRLYTEPANKQFRMIECGDSHSAVVSKTGELFTFGDNSEGQLGIGIEFKNSIDRVSIITGISEEVLQVSCGFRHTLVLTDHGSVFAMGSNRRFELGNATLQKSSTPIRIQALEMYMIQKVAAGGFSVALTNHNELLVWGSGEFGIFQTPQRVFLEDIRIQDIELSKTAEGFGALVDDQGLVYTWGQNQYGQLGQGDFRFRKLPTKVAQLRKKKVRQISCGGGFVAALGKDVLDKDRKKASEKRKAVDEKRADQDQPGRSKSQVSFGLQNSVRRKGPGHDQERAQLTTINDMHQRSTLRGNSQMRQSHHSTEIVRSSPSNYARSNAMPYTTATLPNHNERITTQENLSIERQKRIQLERDLKDKEYELQTSKANTYISPDVQSQILKYKRDNEVLRDALEKEQENSYKLLSDVHKHISDNKMLKDQLEEKQREIRALHLEQKRQADIARDIEYENDKLKQEAIFITQRADDDVSKMKNYVHECENTIKQMREQLAQKQEQQKYGDAQVEKVMSDNADLKRQLYSNQDKIKALEYQIEGLKKENDDFRYDNTLLYEKNVEKDERMVQLQDQIDSLQHQLEQERSKALAFDQDTRYLQRRIQELEDQLTVEQQKINQRDKAVDEIVREGERIRKDLENQVAAKSIDYDNLKRGYDELQYEVENMRRTVNAKQDEISSLNRIIEQSSHNNNELVNTIKDLENTIKDVEEKNKKLNDLLNATIYNRAEKYKEKVINKLQERTPNNMITPNKTAFGYNHPQISSEVSDQKLSQSQLQPSPIRLQKILSDEKDQVQKDRDRLLKLADQVTRGHDLNKSQGPSYPNSQRQQELSQYRQSLPQFTSPFTQKNDTSVSPHRTTQGFASMFNQSRPNPQQELQPQIEGSSRLRVSDLTYAAHPISTGERNPGSPEGIADLLKQQSPLRKKLATDALQNRSFLDKSADHSMYTPGKGMDDFEDNNGNLTASKITHKLVANELGELRNKLYYMQRDKQDLEQRLSQYESSKSGYSPYK